MNLIDVLSGPWAIEPGKLLEIQSIYATHLRGESIDIEAVEKRLGRPLANERRSYEIIDGVAVIPLEGVIGKKMNMFSQISGGTSSQLATRALEDAQRDAAVHSIVLAIDSPGGTVDGTQIFADAVRATRGKKPIVTHASGKMQSAAVWFGTAADRVYIADGTTEVGSIGVVMSHVDVSGAEAARGVKTTELTAGKYKRIASQYAPLSDDGRKTLQDQLDYLYTIFVEAVATNRGVSVDVVLSDMADARTFIGQQAVDAGLVDGIMPLAALIEKLNKERGANTLAPATPHRAGSARTQNSPTPSKGKSMNKEQIEAEHPALAAELRADGAAAERARIQEVEAQIIPGHEKLVSNMMYDGVSTGGDAAKAVLAAERAARQAHATASASDAPSPVPLAPAPAAPEAAVQEGGKSRAELDAAAKAYMSANPGTSYVQAYKAVGGK